MGKTKTAFVGGVQDKKLSGAEKYKLKQQKKAQEEAAEKAAVKGVGLKGGERVKVVGGDIPNVPESTVVEESKAGLSPKAKRGPRVRGKKHGSAVAKVKKDKLYPIPEAIKLVKETSYSKFDGTIEIHASVKKSDLNVQVTLPHTAGKAKRIEIADDKTIKRLENGKVDFDVLLSTADMMPKLVKFARVLGPKGMMPNPKNGTLIKSKADAKKFSGNAVSVKCEKKVPLVHLPVGKVSQKDKEIKENIEAVFKAIGPKGTLKATLTSTMGPGIKLTVN